MEAAARVPNVISTVLLHLQARVQVPVQPLHDEQHGDAGAAGVGVIDHRAVQVHQALVFRQSPEGEGGGGRGGERADSELLHTPPSTFWTTHVRIFMCFNTGRLSKRGAGLNADEPFRLNAPSVPTAPCF